MKLSDVDGFHNINMSPNTSYYLDTYSNISTPTQVGLYDDSGKQLKMLVDNGAVTDYLKTHAYAAPELFKFKSSDGITLDGYMIKPFNFDPTKKYPVVMTVYGGPESHSVYNQFMGNGWQQWLAQNGYIIVDINNRGVSNYGSAFMKVGYKELGKYEAADFAATAKYMNTLPFVDKGSIAIMGGSYGGYITLYTLFNYPGVFKAGLANSAVTDWRLYDNIYTERYMGLALENKTGYDKSSVITYADKLQDHLLLVHSMSDDNVHPANAMQLLTALTTAGKDVDLRIFPKGAHGAAYDLPSYVLLSNINFQYLEKHLKGNTNLPNLNAKK
jgi:dipeptidyl-peptidase-4